MTCTTCECPGAYVGPQFVQCPNPACLHFDAGAIAKGIDLATSTINGDPILDVRLYLRALRSEATS